MDRHRRPPFVSRRSRWGAGSLLSALLLSATAGCGPSAEQQEARNVVALIDRMRAAAPERREPLLEALERETIRGKAAEQARHRCAGAYRGLLQASRLESRAREQLAYPSPPATALRDLADAEAKLKQATAEMPRCNEALAALRRISRSP